MLISKEDLPKVSVEEMNDIHLTEVDLINRLHDKILEYQQDQSKIEEVIQLFDEFLKDVINHFSFEQSLMEEYNFFAYPVHRGEHDRVLFELKSLEKLLKDKKDVETLKEYLTYNFKPWLINHVQTMDTVTAMYLSNFL